ncbi:MAG: hypothetical protein ACE5IM_03500 [Nitrospinota bacterium]
MKRLWLPVALLTLVLGSPAPGAAHRAGQAGPGGMMMGPGMMGSGMMGMGMMGPGMMGLGRRGMGFGPGMMGMGLMGPGMMGLDPMGLDLSAEQRKKLTDLRIRFIRKGAEARAEILRARAELKALLLDPSVKDEDIEAQVQRAAAARARLFVLRFRLSRQMNGLLTKEQRERWMRRFSPGRGPMGPGQGPMGSEGMMPGGRMPAR